MHLGQPLTGLKNLFGRPGFPSGLSLLRDIDGTMITNMIPIATKPSGMRRRKHERETVIPSRRAWIDGVGFQWQRTLQVDHFLKEAQCGILNAATGFLRRQREFHHDPQPWRHLFTRSNVLLRCLTQRSVFKDIMM